MGIIDKFIDTLTGKKREEVTIIFKIPADTCGLCGIKIRNNTKHIIEVKGSVYNLCNDCNSDIKNNPTMIHWFNPTICSSCGIATKVVYQYKKEHEYSYKSLITVTKGGKDYRLCSDCFEYYQKMRAKRNSYHRSSSIYIKVDGLMDRFLVSGLIEGMSSGISAKDFRHLSIN